MGKPRKNFPVGHAPACKCGCGELTLWNQRKNRWNKYVVGHYRRDAPYKHRDWLIQEYVVRNRSMRDLAVECGVTLCAVRKQMLKHGVPIRGGSAAHLGRQTGANNPAWKGGVTPARQRIYKTAEWRALLAATFARDNYRCLRCGKGKTRQDGLHAHHVTPWADAPELRMTLSNVITLCGPCHTWVHSKQNQLRAYLAA